MYSGPGLEHLRTAPEGAPNLMRGSLRPILIISHLAMPDNKLIERFNLPMCLVQPFHEESLQSDRNYHEIFTWYDNHLPPSSWITTSLSTNESYFSEDDRNIEVCKKGGTENTMGSFSMGIMLAMHAPSTLD